MIQGLAIALALVIAGSGMALWWMDGKVEAANARAAQAREDRGKEEQSRKGFQSAATSCSESVAAMKLADEAKDKVYQTGLAQSRRQTADMESSLTLLLTAPRPAGLDECQATFKELNDEIDDRHPRR